MQTCLLPCVTLFLHACLPAFACVFVSLCLPALRSVGQPGYLPNPLGYLASLHTFSSFRPLYSLSFISFFFQSLPSIHISPFRFPLTHSALPFLPLTAFFHSTPSPPPPLISVFLISREANRERSPILRFLLCLVSCGDFFLFLKFLVAPFFVFLFYLSIRMRSVESWGSGVYYLWIFFCFRISSIYVFVQIVETSGSGVHHWLHIQR